MSVLGNLPPTFRCMWATIAKSSVQFVLRVCDSEKSWSVGPLNHSLCKYSTSRFHLGAFHGPWNSLWRLFMPTYWEFYVLLACGSHAVWITFLKLRPRNSCSIFGKLHIWEELLIYPLYTQSQTCGKLDEKYLGHKARKKKITMHSFNLFKLKQEFTLCPALKSLFKTHWNKFWWKVIAQLLH